MRQSRIRLSDEIRHAPWRSWSFAVYRRVCSTPSRATCPRSEPLPVPLLVRSSEPSAPRQGGLVRFPTRHRSPSLSYVTPFADSELSGTHKLSPASTSLLLSNAALKPRAPSPPPPLPSFCHLVGRCTAKAAQRAPSLAACANRRVGPHMLRSGVDANIIRAWMGHIWLDRIS